ncbi:hypothetical protein BGX27_002179 [Mortierella sp. AM989]|nr:hypothetical protein BGX27_002179 [Mortierella sp. AM989]
MEEIPLEDEPFEPFDDYEDYADQMMQEAEKQDHFTTNAPSNFASSSTSVPRNLTNTSDALPQQQDFLSMLQTQNLQSEQDLQKSRQQQQQQEQQQGQWQKRQGPKSGRTIGSTAGESERWDGAGKDLGSVKIVKKKVKLVKLDNERLLGDHGLPLLMSHGKRFKIRHKYKDSVEKNTNASTMDGWRDAYWKNIREEKETKEDAARAEQEVLNRQNSVWEEHEKDLEAQGSSSIPRPTFTHNADSALSPSISAQPRPKPAISKKGKEKATDNPFASVAMRLAVSDDEDEQEDYERALDRMRISMNLDRENGGSVGMASQKLPQNFSHQENLDIFDAEDSMESISRKNEIDLDNYNSDVEDDEEEEDAPLFTHRALQMMGSSKALEILGQNKTAIIKATPQLEITNPTNSITNSDQEEIFPSLNAATIELTPSLSIPTLPLDSINSSVKVEEVQSMDVADDDEEDIVTTRKPTKSRRTILLDSSDEE